MAMNPITVRILQGVNAGRARTFDQPQLTFGRDAQNDIVVEAPMASRQHGELLFTDADGWQVVNHSANGTTVNGRKVGKKQAALKTGDTIGVGGEKMFDVEIATPAAPVDPPPPAAQSPAAPERPKMSGRSKLYTGIAIYFVVMMLVLFAVSQFVDRSGNDQTRSVPELTDEQIAREITEPLEAPENMREAREALQTARLRYQMADRDDAALYDAYHNFQLAYAQSRGELFSEGLAFREFKKCEDELVEKVTRLYRNGYAQLQAGQWAEADRTLRLLIASYGATSSQIRANVFRQLDIIASHRKR